MATTSGLYPQTKILSRNFDVPDAWKLSVARARGGYASFEKALRSMTPARDRKSVV